MNTVFKFEVENIFIDTKCSIFSPKKVLKYSKPGRKLDQFTYRSFPQNELCVVDTHTTKSVTDGSFRASVPAIHNNNGLHI